MTASSEIAWLIGRARRQPDDVAVVCGDERVTWAGLAARAEALACGFARLGVHAGDIVAVRAAPSPTIVAAFHALQFLGAAMLPLNTRLARPEIERILAHALPRLLIDENPEAPGCGPATALSFNDVIGAPRKSDAARSFIDPGAALTVVYTSGTTGVPKGVVLTNANYAASAAASRRRLGHGADDAWLATVPLFHVGGLAILARAAIEGSTVVLENGFDAARCAAVLENGDATMLSLVPTMLHRVLERGAGRVSPRIRCVLVGGAALSPRLGRRALDAGLPIAATYGMTEACSQIATSRPGSNDAASGAVGMPLDGIDIRIEPRDGNIDAAGEILIRGPAVMRGYLRNADADRKALQNGWFATGDLGRLLEDGALEVLGRSDDLIVTGGENVSPNEIERVLDEHAAVAESMVAGASDDEWGQRIVAFVVLREGETEPKPGELDAWCRARLAAYKIPRELRFVGELPRNAMGKLLRGAAF
jgi:O-succinylbenzoic acid--CoA ligase